MDDLYHRAISFASTPASKWPSLALLTADAFLCVLIIWKIPCYTPPPLPFPFLLPPSLLTLFIYFEQKRKRREGLTFFGVVAPIPNRH